MADLSKIKVGDTLRLEVQVTKVDIGDQVLPIRISSNDWISSELVETAEHIPAPKTFKRGDWVRWESEDGSYRHCLVLGPDPFDVDLLEIHLLGSSSSSVLPSELEPDEAPE